MRRQENILALVDFDFAHGLREWSPGKENIHESGDD